ncbi:MAG: prolyl oligopeptidase family serine peptidase, partial [Candidatus Eiseniibacteriota bacterium]
PVKVVAILITVAAILITVAATDMATARVASPAPPFATGDTLRIERALGLPGRSGPRRAPFPIDPVEARCVDGTWRAPRAGESVRGDAAPQLAGEDDRVWSERTADAEGWISDPELAGGYLFARVTCARAGVYLLDAAGHRWVRVNGVPRVGDVYRRGTLRLPVRLRQGTNELLFRQGWGAIRARLEPPPAPVYLAPDDATLPSLVHGDPAATALAGIVVVNAGTAPRDSLTIVARLVAVPDRPGAECVSRVGALAPARLRKVAVALPVPAWLRDPIGAGAVPGAVPDSLRYALELRVGDAVVERIELALDVVEPGDQHYRSFVSDVDGSVQHYGVTPPPSPPDTLVGLVLTLHGANVTARQAHHYAPRDWAYIVAPTNRRAFGFDWEDWGRLDALEVMADARRHFPLDPRRTWLTGHSMGGHGTWSLGVLLPNRFAAIAPSAGWRDFWSYSGAWMPPDTSTTASAPGSDRPEGMADAAALPATTDPVAAILVRATSPSRPLLLERNLEAAGVYVLHGELDDNVPVGEARFMRERLGRFHPDFAYHEQPGAGHWWGDACMDWPPLMEFLRRHALPPPGRVGTLDVTIIHPAIASRCAWLSIEQQELALAPSRVRAVAEPDSARVRIETENVRRLGIDLEMLGGDGTWTVWVDSTRIRAGGETASTGVPRGATSRAGGGVPVVLERGTGGWYRAGPLNPARKGPHRAGPFKEAFRNRMMFVYATGGDATENAWAEAKAHYDAETFYYRGNGAVEVVPDSTFDAAADPHRNVILYGNADTHLVWRALLGDCPIEIRRGWLRVGGRRLAGDDLACLFVHPRAGSDVASVGVIGGTGIAGACATDQLPIFVSGVAYPDWVVIGADVLERGLDGVRGAGFFDSAWRPGADSAWR